MGHSVDFIAGLATQSMREVALAVGREQQITSPTKSHASHVIHETSVQWHDDGG